MTRVLGCDVSRWQDDISTPQRINFDQMRDAGARFVFIKASQGTWADRDILYNWQAAKDAGLYRGAYHYFDWRDGSEEQARFFAGLLRDDPGELPPVFDYEMRGGVPGRSAAIARAQAFIQTFEDAHGKPLMIYTSPGYWREFGSYSLVGNRKLWLAHYYTDAPAVPHDWVDWTFWQYTDLGDGLRFGAESLELDMNWYNGDWSQFTTEFGELFIEPPAPEPQPAGLYEVLVNGLRIRQTPGRNGRILGSLRAGEILEALETWTPETWIKHPRGWSCLEDTNTEYMRRIDE